jgi:hypothetical protein
METVILSEPKLCNNYTTGKKKCVSLVRCRNLLSQNQNYYAQLLKNRPLFGSLTTFSRYFEFPDIVLKVYLFFADEIY